MTNFTEIWTILNCHTFQIDPQISVYVNCIICNKLLIDAYRGPCWCNYCKRCAENYFGINKKYCPGENIDCRLVEISVEDDIVKDNSADHRVSKLDIQCPWSLCEYRGRLGEMHEHLRTCNKKPIECPFIEIGCTTILQENESITDHLLTEICQHCNLLMEWTKIMRNNIFNAAIKGEQEKIENMRENITILLNDKIRLAKANWRNTRIRFLQQEIRNTLLKNNDLKQQIKNLQENSNRKILIIKEFLDKQRILIGQLKNGRQSGEHKMVQSESNENRDIQNQTENSTNSSISLFKKLNYSQETTHATISDGKCKSTVDIIGSFAWNISELSKKKKSRVNLKTIFFYSNDNRYMMWMILYPGGYEDSVSTHISIVFYIRSRQLKDAYLLFPLSCNVSMTITNAIQYSSEMTISRPCYFSGKDVNNETFHFPVDELDKVSVITSDEIIIKCKLMYFQ